MTTTETTPTDTWTDEIAALVDMPVDDIGPTIAAVLVKIHAADGAYIPRPRRSATGSTTGRPRTVGPALATTSSTRRPR
jgi:hypothetical protein